MEGLLKKSLAETYEEMPKILKDSLEIFSREFQEKSEHEFLRNPKVISEIP